MENEPEILDVIIIGGGPSGLSTALHLAQYAPELLPGLLVLEKEHYPRPKLCAGGLVADAEVVLERLGLDMSEVPHVDASAAHFDFGGKGLTVSLPKTHTLRIVRRDEFDAWLAEKARERGIRICEGVSVKGVTPERDAVTVETQSGRYRARLVVGADGSNGIVRRCVLPEASVSTARVLEVLTPLPETGPARNAHKQNEAYFDFRPVPNGIAGYTWDFPTQLKGQPMRCWGIYDTNLLAGMRRPPLKESLATEMARFGFDLGEYDLQGHPIRWFDPLNKFCVPRVLLVGDAVGADSIFGEGISMALAYGNLAAREAAEACRRNDFRLTGYKRRVLLSPLGQTLFMRWLLTVTIYPLRWRWFQFLLWRILQPVVLLVAWLFVLNWARRMK